jgi:Protein of unknown function (DUF2786)
MSAPETILLKIKLLLNLSQSSNPNEAENAKLMADKLVAKYGVTEAELAALINKKASYDDNERLFFTVGLVSWRQRLALSIAKYFFCSVVQEEVVPMEGFHQFNYFLFGESDDMENVRIAYAAFSKKVDELFKTKCIGRGEIYLASYGEGVVESIANNIYWDGIDIPGIKKPAQEAEKLIAIDGANLSKVKEEKPPSVEQTVDVATQTFIKDVMAYFKGLEDGKNLSLRDILEIESKEE